jgi:integrase/recombinase XerD
VLVQRVVMPVTGAESWTVLGDDAQVLEPVEDYLAHLAAIERSPNTVRAYAMSLKLWFEFLAEAGAHWSTATIDEVARFVSWLRAPGPNVIVLQAGAGRRSAATVNRHLAGIFGFYDYQARAGVQLAGDLVAWRRVGRGSYKPFLHHATKGKPIPTRPVKLAVVQRLPQVLSAEQVAAVLAACDHLRDRFLMALLSETGIRIGQALGLHHCDFVSRDRELRIVPRTDNANGARAKVRRASVLPVSVPLVRLYSDYMHTEYGDLDSDYVFVNLFGGRRGRPLTYDSVNKLIERLRARTGVSFTAHMLRHTHATDLVRRGVPIEMVAKMLTHRSSRVTRETYTHLSVEDIRAALHSAGMWSEEAGKK